MTHKNKKSCKQCVIESKCRELPKIAKKKKKSRKQCMIEFKPRELPKIAQNKPCFKSQSNQSQFIRDNYLPNS